MGNGVCLGRGGDCVSLLCIGGHTEHEGVLLNHVHTLGYERGAGGDEHLFCFLRSRSVNKKNLPPCLDARTHLQCQGEG